MRPMTAELADGRTVEFYPTAVGEGGMKVVYFTTDKKSVICFFKDQADDAARRLRLERIVTRYNPTIPRSRGGAAADEEEAQEYAKLFCWPIAIVTKPHYGVMAPAYRPDFYFEEGYWKGKEKQGKWFASPKIRKLLPDSEKGDFRSYLLLCHQMSRAISKLHMMGLAHSDLSGRNILIDPKRGQCVVIDVDGLVVPNLYPPEVLGTPGYIAPEVMVTQALKVDDPAKNLPRAETDLHALAVLIYEYLLRRHPLRGPRVNSITSAEEDERLSMGELALFVEHPTDLSNRLAVNDLSVPFARLGPYLAPLMQQAFVDGLHDPAVRPSAPDWERALARTLDLLMPCGNPSCEEKWLIYIEGEKPRCPFCNWRYKGPLLVLDFHYQPRPGHFLPERHHMVAFPDRPLHEWHAFSNVLPGASLEQAPVAHLEFAGGRWLLRNKTLGFVVAPDGNPVPGGEVCSLEPGGEILLSREAKGRILSVRVI